MFNLKKVIASVAALALSLSCFSAFAADFSDVEATAAYKTAIDELVALEIVNGYEDGTFKPDNEITRAEVTKMVVAAMGPSYTAAAESSVGGSGFADVDPVGHWASGFIATGVAQKFINGMGDGTFAPDANVTYAQIVKMLVAALGYGVQAERDGGYPNGYLQMGNTVGITTGVRGISAETPVTRGQVAQLISNAVKAPIVAVTSWNTNYVTGEPVAVTEPQDGRDGGKHKTLLTENHDVYVVKGRVSATKAAGGASLKPDEVQFTIEYTDNFKDAKLAKGRNMTAVGYDNDTDDIVAKIGDTAAADYLFTYAEALVKVDELEGNEILAITPYGRNEIVELLADDYDTASTISVLQFDRNSTSSKNDKYELDTAKIKLFVNGVKIADNGDYLSDGTTLDTSNDLQPSDLATYIQANSVGKVTLIDAPGDDGKAKDGEFDVIMVTYPMWAVIEETAVQGDNLKIYFEEFQTGVGATVTIDTTDEDLVYSFTKNGEEVEFEDIKAGDVALITFDPNASSLNRSDFMAFDLCDTVVEGTISGSRKENGTINVYTVNGEEYKLVDNATLEVTYDYTFYLDAAGRVVKYKELASTKNYAVIDKVAYSTDKDAYTARLIKPDGTRTVVTVKATGSVKGTSPSDTQTKTPADLYNMVYNTSKTLSEIKSNPANTLKTIENRMVAYKVNTAGELNNVEALDIDMTAASTAYEYVERSNKVNTIKMNDATAIIDLSGFTGTKDWDDVDTYTASDIKAGSLDSFVDGETYKVIAADEDDNGISKFVLITEGNPGVGINTGFAIIDSTASEMYEDGTIRDTLNVFDANSNGEIVKYFCDEDLTGTTSTLKRGTVVALVMEDGVVTDVKTVFAQFATKAAAGQNITWAAGDDFMGITAGKAVADGTTTDAFFRASVDAIAKWETTTAADPNGWARLGFGIIVGRNGSNVEFVNPLSGDAAVMYKEASTGTQDATTQIAANRWAKETNVKDFDLAEDANIYVIDMNYEDEEGSGRLSVGATSSLMVTPSVKRIKAYASGSNTAVNVVDFTNSAIMIDTNDDGIDDTENGGFVYAFFKVVENDITDIIVYIPQN